MCGITFININDLHTKPLNHRGPDDNQVVFMNSRKLIFDRLCINDLSSNGSQPFFHTQSNTAFMCNGEIYNHKQLLQDNSVTMTKGDSDCEVVYHMLNHKNNSPDIICKLLDGVFAFAYTSPQVEIVARDPIGIRPLFYGKSKADPNVYNFASEAKALLDNSTNIKQFPPGHTWDSKNGFQKYNPLSLKPYLKMEPSFSNSTNLHNLLIQSVSKRLPSDVDYGFFLSGGLDSSIIASIAAKLVHPKKIKTFSVGTKGFSSPDLIAAEEMAKFLDSEHHVFEFSLEDGLKSLDDVIWHLESFDITTIRASVPMYLLSKHIKENFPSIKVMFSGEGADELFGGYIYFHNAPSTQEFHDETIRLIKDVHKYDALRADRCTAAHGLELRVPFFDKAFVEYITNDIVPEIKMPSYHGIEKYILRKAFEEYLPQSIYNRQKNGMSDAVGYSWIDYLKDNLKDEANHYKMVYDKWFTDLNHIDYMWMPKWTESDDPSARQIKSLFKE